MCALRHGGGYRVLPREHWRKRPVAGVRHKTIGSRMVTMGAVRRRDNRDREVEVIAVNTGTGQEALPPVIPARPSGIARCGEGGA